MKRVNAVDVAGWFKKAWPNATKYPDRVACDDVAISVNIVADVEIAKPHRKLSKHDAASTKESYIIALKGGRAFVRHSSMLRDDMEKRLPSLPLVPDGFQCRELSQLIEASNEIIKKIDAINEAERALNAVFKLIQKPTPWKGQDRFRWIANAAVKAWKQTDVWKRTDVKPKFGKKEDGPLTAFVDLALTKISFGTKEGKTFSRETISQHLRGRQARSRSGKHRAVKKGGAN